MHLTSSDAFLTSSNLFESAIQLDCDKIEDRYVEFIQGFMAVVSVLVVDLAVVGVVATDCVAVINDGVVVVGCCFVVDGCVVDDGSIVVGCFVVADSIVLVVNAGVVVFCCNVIDEVVCCFVVDDNLIVGNDCTVVDVDGDVVVVECIFVAVVVELMTVVSEVVDVWGDNDISPEDVDFVVDIVIGRSQIFGSI